MCWIRASSLGALALGIVSVGLAGPAAAQSSPTDEAMAETLFADAKKHMVHGDYADACPKLAESYRLDPGAGTLTALALCHEHTGKTATAWAEFVEVRTEARQGGRADREKYARQHIAALEPMLSRLTISVAPETARLADLAVRRDKVTIGPAAWGVASPVDPGEHVVEAVAPGKLSWSIHVFVSSDGDTKSLVIPALDDEPAPAKPAERPEVIPPVAQLPHDALEPVADAPSPVHRGGLQRAIGWALGGAGVASLGVGSYFGLQALAKSRDANRVCSPSSCTNASAVQTNDNAKSDATAADALLGGGLVAVLAGAIVYFSAPRGTVDAPAGTASPSARAGHHMHVFPAIARQGGGMLVETAW